MTSRGAATFFLIAVVAAGVFTATRETERERVFSPDHRAVAILYARDFPYACVFAMPGQGSDRPGTLRVFDRQGRMIDEQNVVLLSAFSSRWAGDHHLEYSGTENIEGETYVP